jgi:triacylglycerol esterase/lipase EstA (alpha/beta hydrolase family)
VKIHPLLTAGLLNTNNLSYRIGFKTNFLDLKFNKIATFNLKSKKSQRGGQCIVRQIFAYIYR